MRSINKNWKSLYYKLGSHFLNLQEVKKIDNLLKKFPLEYITVGDAGEINNCQVGRLVEDKPNQLPKRLNIELSNEVLNLYSSKKAIKFFRQFFDNDKPLIVRRSQFNLLHKGSFVGRHLDIDSNPDYQIAAVLQLGSKFKGGEFYVYNNKLSNDEDAQKLSPEYGSLTISFCKHEHEVKTVTAGTRTSFVCFISDFAGINKRK